MIRNFKLFFGFILLIYVSSIEAQTISSNLICSSGDRYKTTDFQLDWSIGEIATDAFTNNSTIMTQGFHQGNLTITSVTQIKSVDFEINAYPNPTRGIIHIKVSDASDLNYLLLNVSGVVISNNPILDADQLVKIENVPNGIYFLNILKSKQLIKVFKIIKAN